MVMTRRAKYASLSVMIALTATGLGAVVPHSAYKALADPLAMIRHYSPGARTAGALPNKFRPKRVVVRRVARAAPVHVVHREVRPAKVAMRQPKPVSAVLPTAIEAPMALGPTSVPIAAVGSPIPAAFAPVLASGGGAVAGPGALGLLAIPAGIAIGANHGGGGTNSQFAPAAPEPGTWLMMIFGFGFLGTTIRKRRSALRKVDQAGLVATRNAASLA